MICTSLLKLPFFLSRHFSLPLENDIGKFYCNSIFQNKFLYFLKSGCLYFHVVSYFGIKL